MVLLPVLGCGGCSRAPQAASYAMDWDIKESMAAVARRHTGVPGVVLHVGDSNTLDPAYSAWALRGEGKTPEDVALLEWMHVNKGGDLDGWTLCSAATGPKRSVTASSGCQLGQVLVGDRVDHSLSELIRRYNPQIVVVMLGTNDATVRRSVAKYGGDLRLMVDALLANGTIPLMTTLPPHGQRAGLVAAYNQAIYGLAREKRLPLVDLYGEIFRRRPGDWQDIFMQRDGLHLTSDHADAKPIEANLNRSGHLLRAWLTIRMIAEIKLQVLDGSNN